MKPTPANLRLAKRRRKVLDKVLETISTGPRSILRDGRGKETFCIYAGEMAADDGTIIKTACAVGMLIPRSLGKYLDTFIDTSVENDELFGELPPYIQSLGQEFLAELQTLHDRHDNWTNPTGPKAGDLTRKGQAFVRDIFRKFIDPLDGE